MSPADPPVRRGLPWRRRPAALPYLGAVADEAAQAPTTVELPPLDIDVDDPLLAYVTEQPHAVAVDQLRFESPAVAALRDAGITLVVPLVAHGELVGLLNLGPRRSERAYSSDDKRLLEELASHAAPAIRVAQLVAEQQAEAAERERVQQELHVAQLIQQQFLPSELPSLTGWHVSAYYQPAREVGGDFYDFLELPDGRLGLVAGDVTGKGVPAALVMATTHSLLRAEAPRLVEPGTVLQRVNDLLVDEMPPTMFVTCLYAVLDPATGELRVANAGHNPPYVARDGGVVELRARGMPLGLMPQMRYEPVDAVLAPSERMLLHSDGLAEAHDPRGEMYGFPRLAAAVAASQSGQALLDDLLGQLRAFVGPGWEQEDDITLVALERSGRAGGEGEAEGRRVLAEFSVASEAGNEREVMARVTDAVASVGLRPAQLERLRTAVGEATMNAIEHGNEGRADVQVEVRVLVGAGSVRVQVTDHGGDPHLPAATGEAPDLEAKLAGRDSPRGWGLFLMRSMVDAVTSSSDGDRHTLELVLDLEGTDDASHAV